MRKKTIFLMVLILLVILTAYVCITQYSFVFARLVQGEIVAVQKITDQLAILSGKSVDPAQMFSFAVAIRVKDGEIVTASTEDRQWAVAEKGQCVDARFYPYPPWDLDKSGTYHNARLVRLYDCPVAK